MLRSLFSGVAGMKAHQQKMDIIGNNIANVNTAGYKASRVTFKDMYYQTMMSATSSDGTNTAGNNASQIGYGSQLGSIDILMSRSGFQNTGKTLDFGIAGEGFFKVQDSAGQISYTRAGNFSINKEGYLIDASGNFVLGTANPTMTGAMPTTGTPPVTTVNGTDKIQVKYTEPAPSTTVHTYANLSTFSVGSDGVLTGTYTDTAGATVKLTFGRIDVATFDNASGLIESGNTCYKESPASGAAKLVAPGKDGGGSVVSGALEMSNVDLSQEFADMITTQRGFQANSRIITTSDSILEELVNLKR